MSLHVLILGKVHGKPEQHTSRGGRPFATAKLRVAQDGGDGGLFVSVVAFAGAVSTALLALDDGDGCSVAGAATARAWTDREGNARPALDVIAEQVMTAYVVRRKRRAAAGEHDDDGGRHHD